MPGDTYDVIVIGAGVNGLAAAATLARAGRRTIVLERGDGVGGSFAPLEFAPGFLASPLALDGAWLPPAVARAVGLETAAVTQIGDETAPSLSVAVEPGRFLPLPHPGRTSELAALSKRDADAWPAFVERIRSMCGFLESLYQQAAPDLDATGAGELFDLARLALRLRGLGRDGMTDLLRTVPMSVAGMLDDTFETEPLKAGIAAVGLRGLRQGPRSGGTAFSLLHNVVGAGASPSPAWAGRHVPGGPRSLAAAFEDAARRAGVVIRTNAPVARIEVRDYAVSGVALDTDETIAAGTVLSSADASRTMLGMVDPVWLDPEFLNAIRNIRYRGCTSFVLFAVDRLPPVPGLPDSTSKHAGTVSLTPTMEGLERAYDATKYGRTADRPHVEVTFGGGNDVVVARVGWVGGEGEGPSLADRVTEAIGCIAPGFEDRVLHRVELSVRGIEERYGYTGGATSQGEMALDQILFMRPVAGWSRYAMPVDGLYLCGAGTHPGPGVAGGPGCLAAREVLRPSRR